MRVSDLQLHCACGVLQQADGLRVAHAFGRRSADADDAVADLQEFADCLHTRGTTVMLETGPAANSGFLLAVRYQLLIW